MWRRPQAKYWLSEGRVEKEVSAVQAKKIIFDNGYFVVPAILGDRSYGIPI